MCRLAPLLLVVLALSLQAAAPKKSKSTPQPIGPQTIVHANALFLADLSDSGKRQMTFRATAVGTRFFLEEPAGTTVYRFDNGNYVREEFLRNTKLAGAMKRYAVR